MRQDNLMLLIMAHPLEIKPFIRQKEVSILAEKPFKVYRCEHWMLVLSGVGKANAAMATTYGILNYNPGYVCNLGAAGALKDPYSLGEVYHVERIAEHDRINLESGKPALQFPDRLSGFDVAALVTGDKPLLMRQERESAAKLADLADMEGAAIAQTCRRFGTPCYFFKFISDTPEHSTSADIVKFIKEYRDGFFNHFNQIILPACSRRHESSH